MKNLAQIKYNLLKSWYNLWQKYDLHHRIKQLRNLFILLLIVWIGGSIITIINEYIFAEEQHDIMYYLNFFFFTVKTILSADFSDFLEYTTITAIISIFMVIAGISVIGLFTGEIISMLVNVLEKNNFISEKPTNFYFKHPVIICGNNKNIDHIIFNLKKNMYKSEREIIIIAEDADTIEKKNLKFSKDVYYLKGNPRDRKTLTKAFGGKININKVSAIILATDMDYESIETSLAIEAYNEMIYTIVELNNKSSQQYLENSKVDEYIVLSEHGTKLISQAAINNNITKVYDILMGIPYHDDKAQEITTIKKETVHSLIDSKKNMTYHDIKSVISERKKDIIILGFEKNYDDIDLNADNILNKKIDRIAKTITQINPVKNYSHSYEGSYYKIVNQNPILSEQTILKPTDKIIFISTNLCLI